MLTLIWLIPLVGGAIVCFLPRPAAKPVALAVTLVTLILSAYVAATFNTSTETYYSLHQLGALPPAPPPQMQFIQQVDWIPQYHISYLLGVDGISLWLVVLNSFLGLVAVLATPQRMGRLSLFLGLLLLMQAGMSGVFMALDLILFYVFWEAMLIPAYFLLWLWSEGEERPGRAAIKFVLYTLVGSLLLLVGFIAEYVATGQRSFDLPALLSAPRPDTGIQFGLFILMAFAFAIKVPVFPFHSWLPDAYMAAPTPMLITFAGVMGKTGAYAFLRFVLPLLPHPVLWWDWNIALAILAAAGIIYGGFLALAQTDMKAIVAYSSISHMGFIVLGIFALNAQGAQGAVLQMVNHGIIIAALFLLVAWLAARTGTRDRDALRGLAPKLPILTGVFLVVTLAALGLPGLNSFAGEFMTMLGAWQASASLAAAVAVGLILTPVYMLRMFQGAFYGPAPARDGGSLVDLAVGEIGVLAPLVILMFVLGLFPYVITRAMN
ncbi:MAG TPA: NADH-quinone oxidoreductase subunit M [Candidatus Dormibacteraeota bacterium]